MSNHECVYCGCNLKPGEQCFCEEAITARNLARENPYFCIKKAAIADSICDRCGGSGAHTVKFVGNTTDMVGDLCEDCEKIFLRKVWINFIIGS